MPLLISSLQNQRIKQTVKLNNRRQRDEQQRTVVEGVREVSRALAAGLTPYEAYVCPELLADAEAAACLAALADLANRGQIELFEVTPAVFAKIAYRGESGGIVLVVPYLPLTLADLPVGRPPFLVVVEAVEKPGNLGAILRTADAAGVDGLIVCGDDGEGTDIHNPNVIRASLGALFAVPTVATTNGRAQQWLREQAIPVIAATPEGTRPYTAVDLTGPVAILLGSEAHGLSRAWLQAAEQQVVIPMHGVVDSLNLSVATALLLYEVVRQRSPQPG
ncbi:MAG: RNA methyltransferase [Chloroflexi bacterium]|nr:RNA methyltransferase [Chloroflexota bacterium]